LGQTLDDTEAEERWKICEVQCDSSQSRARKLSDVPKDYPIKKPMIVRFGDAICLNICANGLAKITEYIG
jgi:hypothetical protein